MPARPARDSRAPSPAAALTLPLRGPAGEPVDLRRVVNSHGLADLAPMRVVDGGRRLEVTLATGRGDGSHHFSTTLEEHNAAVQRYLRQLRQQRSQR